MNMQGGTADHNFPHSVAYKKKSVPEKKKPRLDLDL